MALLIRLWQESLSLQVDWVILQAWARQTVFAFLEKGWRRNASSTNCSIVCVSYGVSFSLGAGQSNLAN